MLQAGSRLQLNYSLVRRLQISYSVWRNLSVLTAANQSQRNSRSQVQITRCKGTVLAQSLSSRLLPHENSLSPVLFTQRRYISIETYEKYFSPDSPPIAVIMYYLNSVHDMTGLPWFVNIGICTILLRIVIALPLRIVAKKNAGKNKVMNAYIKAYSESMQFQVQQEAAKEKWSEKKAKGILAKRVHLGVRKARQQTGAHPIKTVIYPMLQVPVWICMSLSLRNMAGYRVFNVEAVLNNPEMIKEGAFWFTNLLVPDPTIIIPVTIGALHLINNEVNTYNMPKGIGTAVVKWLGRGFSLIFIPFACIVPSAISLYWTYSAFTAVLVSLVLNLEWSKKYLTLEPPGTPEFYYRYYKAMIEKETGIVVPEQTKEKESSEEKKNTEESSVQTNTNNASSVSDHKNIGKDIRPREHTQPSELSRPEEHNKFNQSKQSKVEKSENQKSGLVR